MFKTVIHLPPFMDILFGLGMLWMVGDLLHLKKDEVKKENYTLARALTRIDMASIILIGSAAGVAAVGMEKMDFMWYVRKISGLALIGYFAAAAVYIAQYRLLH